MVENIIDITHQFEYKYYEVCFLFCMCIFFYFEKFRVCGLKRQIQELDILWWEW